MTYQQPPEPNPHGPAPGSGPAGPSPQYGGPGPSQGDFATEWGIKEHPGRPKKINQLTQLLWAYFGLSVLMLVFAIMASALIPFFGGLVVASNIVGLIFHGLAIAIAWFITRDRLGAFGAADPRMPLYIGFGILGFFSLGGIFSWGLGWFGVLSLLVGLARIAAVAAGFYLLTQPEVEQYLRSRPGNQRKPPHQPPPYGQQPPPPPGPPPGHPTKM
ncbi:MAG TPA: hypothetical protein VHG10_01860 [Glycomyces sp.]|nr:hypothetical protein [Glycomyces sp.]